MLDQFQELRMALNGLGYVNIVADDVGLFGTLLAINLGITIQNSEWLGDVFFLS